MYIKRQINAVSLRCITWVFCLMCAIGMQAQTNMVKGVVLDETKTPLIGATVQLKGGTTGTVTNIDGEFNIKLKKGDFVKVSYIGYKTIEVKYSGQSPFTINLKPDSKLIDEVVVVGYGTMKKSDLTGSVASVSSKDVKGYQSSSIAGALSGQIAGVQITSTDGTPGSGFNINIRGVGTLTGDASPLYIVDGFEVDNIDYLSNSDIASIEILKDASSSAIYGARAANGVVMITTKMGKKGKPQVSYSGSATYRVISHKLSVLSPYEFVKLQGEVDEKYLKSYYKEVPEDGETLRFNSLEDYVGVDGIDWQDETFNPTWSQDHNLSLTGGSKNSKYNLSLSRYDENGIFKNSGFDKTTGKLRVTQDINRSLSFDAIINYALTNRKGVGTSADRGRFNMLAQILSARPTGGLRLTDEELLHAAIDPEMLEEGGSLAQVNPVLQTESVTNTKRAEMWSGNLSLTWKVMKGLTFKTAATYSTTNSRNNVFFRDGSKEAYRNGNSPYGQTNMGRDVRFSNYNNLTWKQRIRKHSYDVMLGEEFSFRSNEYLLGQAMGFPFDNLGNDNLGLGANPSKVDSYYGENKRLSFFARGNYSYNDRYLLTATLRADGSTVFSQKNKWGIFPSFSAAWRVSEEPFIKNIGWISNLKLRLGWGVVGNDRIPNYLSMDLYESQKYGVGNQVVTVINPKQLKNKNLKWEGSSTVNFGIDWGILRNRISLTADFFLKDTKNLLLAQSLAHVTGFDSQMQNIGKIRNKGIELSLNTVNFKNKNFQWQTNFNVSIIKNTLESLADGVDAMYARSGFDGNFTSYDYIAKVGESLGLIYGYKFDGVYQSDDFVMTPSGKMELKPGIPQNMRYQSQDKVKGAAPGVVKYRDIDGDGMITPNDRTVIGNAMPKWFGGITNTFNIYNWDVNFMFQFNYGNDIYNATRLYATQTRSARRNMLAEVADRWKPDHASNKVPSQDGYIVNDVYSRFVEDGSFLRLKNITVGYTFPKHWLKKIGISKLRAYSSAQNLFCLTHYSGYDPEVNSASNNPMTPGLDWGAYPKSRVFTFGLDIQF